MVAGGLPHPRPDHPQAVADLALTMREEVTEPTYRRLRDGYRFERRGPVQVKGLVEARRAHDTACAIWIPVGQPVGVRTPRSHTP